MVKAYDSKIGTTTYPFPANEHKQEVVAHNQKKHGRGKEVEIGKEAVETILFMHIANGINMDDEPNTRNYKHHDKSKRIYLKTEINCEVAGSKPGPNNLFVYMLAFRQHKITDIDEYGGNKR